MLGALTKKLGCRVALNENIKGRGYYYIMIVFGESNFQYVGVA